MHSNFYISLGKCTGAQIKFLTTLYGSSVEKYPVIGFDKEGHIRFSNIGENLGECISPNEFFDRLELDSKQYSTRRKLERQVQNLSNQVESQRVEFESKIESKTKEIERLKRKMDKKLGKVVDWSAVPLGYDILVQDKLTGALQYITNDTYFNDETHSLIDTRPKPKFTDAQKKAVRMYRELAWKVGLAEYDMEEWLGEG